MRVLSADGRFWLSLALLTVAALAVAQTAVQDEDEEATEEEEEDSPAQKQFYKFLVKRLKQSAADTKAAQQRAVPQPYGIPGPFEPLPGRSHNGDYWPLFPFQNQYSGGVDLDPSISRHIGGDINIPVPSWGMMDIPGHFFNRIADTTTKFGYVSHPVNMLGLSKEDFATLVSDPRLAANRYAQPLIPLGKVPKSNVPISCKAPMCNPYQSLFALGIEHDFGGHDGNEGDINIPFPVSKGVAYRFPFGGNYYYHLDNITVTYGHNLSPMDPYSNPYMFNNDYSRRRELLPRDQDVFPQRRRRSLVGFVPVVLEEVPEPSSASAKIRPTDFKSYRPLARLRRLAKRDTGTSVADRLRFDSQNAPGPFRKEIFERSDEPNGEQRLMRLTLEKVIIPAASLTPTPTHFAPNSDAAPMTYRDVLFAHPLQLAASDTPTHSLNQRTFLNALAPSGNESPSVARPEVLAAMQRQRMQEDLMAARLAHMGFQQDRFGTDAGRFSEDFYPPRRPMFREPLFFNN